MIISQTKITAYLFKLQCERCGYKWETVAEEPPLRCADCKTPYWNRPRRHTRERLGSK